MTFFHKDSSHVGLGAFPLHCDFAFVCFSPSTLFPNKVTVFSLDVKTPTHEFVKGL